MASGLSVAEPKKAFSPRPLNLQFVVPKQTFELLHKDDDENYYDEAFKNFNDGKLAPDLAKEFNKATGKINKLTDDDYLDSIKDKLKRNLITQDDFISLEGKYKQKLLNDMSKEILETGGLIQTSLLDDLPLDSEDAANLVTTIFAICNSKISPKFKMIQLAMISNSWFDLGRNNLVAFLVKPKIMLKFIESDVVDGLGTLALGLIKKPGKWLLNKLSFW